MSAVTPVQTSTQPDSLLCSLPPELILAILDQLDPVALLRIKSVCRLFKTLVEDTANLQYHIELAANGLVDGPRSGLSATEKLDMLRKRQTAWDKLLWVDQKRVPMTNGHLYELYGGVLAQSSGQRSLVFRRLPSHFRRIEERVWTIEDVGVSMRDFGMDPGQDLLVIIEEAEEPHKMCRIHLRKLSTGGPHPSTSDPHILLHRPVTRFPSSYNIQVCGDFVGVCFMGELEVGPELSIWNWKTRTLQMTLDGPIFCFAFLSRCHVIVSLDTMPTQSLSVYNFVDREHGAVTVEDETHTFKFMFPPYRSPLAPVDIIVRCDPCPDWTAPSDVPFYVAPDNRTYVVTLVYDVQFGTVGVYSLFIPASTFLSRLPPPQGSYAASVSERQRDFAWTDWGPTGCRMLSSLRLSLSWVCWVYGSKFVSWDMGVSRGTLLRPKIYDFNLRGLRRSESSAENNEYEHMIGQADGDPLALFTESMITSYPYRMKSTSLNVPGWTPTDTNSVMLSEDSIILVSAATRREFIILTF
ncbi:hypothetical protein GLOTRDRAFT_135147 [Gloeophyllum trabeum ATCC 11539]|uniref:F-box domain-containing protein n=1 Tax=Gloeophyllum trabeum (strain ATCC 11539 / FP-39264 / Madison 617) TaxID=670483 RepID=S7QL41_GLOTA|nr:uncharacterized protein GLOTRDRAFT_135147 [Gloeophyllum trabeum ATCC 11539]EPQ60476.1 hypothetical protein GLOTRDRAFT_135147 [Gloeophyllum trabeum ATCC 11539]